MLQRLQRLEINSLPNWLEMTTEQIIGGKSPDGVRYLQLFLKDYTSLFNVQNVCANCNNAIAEYHKKYISKVMEKDNTCQYRLLEKYNGIQLDTSCSTFINNGNITDEYGDILFKNRGGAIFSKMPTQKIVVTDAKIVNNEKTIVEPTKVKTKHSRNKKR